MNSLDTPNTSVIFYRTLAASDDFPNLQFVEYIKTNASNQSTDDVVYSFYLYAELLSTITNPSLSDLQSMITNSQMLMTQQQPAQKVMSTSDKDRFAARRHSQEFDNDADEPSILSPPLDALSPRYAPQYSDHDAETDTEADVQQFNELVREYEQTFKKKPSYNNLVGSSDSRTDRYLGLPPRPTASNLRQPPKSKPAMTLSAAKLSNLPKNSGSYTATESDRESIDTDVLEQYASQALQAANNALAEDMDNRSTASRVTPVTQTFNSKPNGRVGRSRTPASITAARSTQDGLDDEANVTTVITPAEADVLDALIVRDDPRVQRAFAAYPQLDLLIRAFLRLAREVVSINDRDEARDVVSRLGRSVSRSVTNQTSRPSTAVSSYSTAAPKLPTNQVFQTVAAELQRRRILSPSEIAQLVQLRDNGSPLLESALQLFAADGDIGLLLERVTKLAKTASAEDAPDDADEAADDDDDEEELPSAAAVASQSLKQHETALKNAHSQLVGNYVSFIEVFAKHGLLDNAEAVALLEALERGDEEVEAAFMTFSQDKDTTELIVKLKRVASDNPSAAAQQIQQRMQPSQQQAASEPTDRSQLDDVDVARIEEHIVSLLPPAMRLTDVNKQQLHALITQMDAELLTAYHQVLDKVLKATHATAAASESAATITKAQQLEVLLAYKKSIDAFAVLIARKLGISAAIAVTPASDNAPATNNASAAPTAARQEEIESNVVTLGNKILELLTASGVLSTAEAAQLKQLLVARDQTTIAAFVVAVNDEDWSALSGRLKMILVMHQAKGTATASPADATSVNEQKYKSSEDEPLDIVQEFTSVLRLMSDDKLLTPAQTRILLSLYEQRDSTLMQALQAWASASGEEVEKINALQERLVLIAQYWGSRLELAEAERQLAEVETARRMLGVEDGDLTNEDQETYDRAHISEVNSEDDPADSGSPVLDHSHDMYASPPANGTVSSVSSTVESVTTKVGDEPALTTTVTSTTVDDGKEEETETDVTFHSEGDDVDTPQQQGGLMNGDQNLDEVSETISIPISDDKPNGTSTASEALSRSISDTGVAVDSLYDGES